MKRSLVIALAALLALIAGMGLAHLNRQQDGALRYSDTEAGFEDADEPLEPEAAPAELAAPAGLQPAPALIGAGLSSGAIPWASYWRPFSPAEERLYAGMQRPAGPPRIGIQAGHAELDKVPEELAGLRASSGAQGGGKSEAETVLIIARQVKALLEAEGFVVDLLPATVPVDYLADAFISIHADGNANASVSGFKIAAPRYDFSGKADRLVEALYQSYGDRTGLRRDANITRRMSGYYAFNWRRYDHAVHPMTPAVIIETGFMTSPTDRAIIVADPARAARGIAEGIIEFLR